MNPSVQTAVLDRSGSSLEEFKLSIRQHLIAAALVAVILVGGIGGWSAFTSIKGAVIAAGQLAVESNVKKLQHPNGGVVEELRVREGDRVKAGDILVRLDETQTRANLEIVLKALDESSARRARDEAERDNAENLIFPADLLEKSLVDPETARLVEGETKLFVVRLAAREGQKSQLRERIGQLREEGSGQKEQADAKAQEMVLIKQELEGVRDLRAKNLVPLSRLSALERDAARLGGERGQLVSAQAQTKGKIAETNLQIMQVDQDMRSEVGKDLAEIRGRWSELIEKKVAAEDQLKRVDLRAPQDGVVQQMAVHTVGGVLAPNETALLIVPDADVLVAEVRVEPNEIDHVRVGQAASLQVAAFDQRTSDQLLGAVSRVSPDVIQDAKTGASYYLARITVTDQHLQDKLKLMPGMPVEAFMQTGDRSVLSYLTKPLLDQLAKAWREH